MQIHETTGDGHVSVSDMEHNMSEHSTDMLLQATGEDFAHASSCHHEQDHRNFSSPTSDFQEPFMMQPPVEQETHDTDSTHGTLWRLGQSCTIYDMAVLVPELQKRLHHLAEQPAKTNIRLDCTNLQELDAAGVQLFLSLATTLSPNTLELYWPNIPDAFAWFVNFLAQHPQHVDLITTYGADDV
jgi:ABC-type transporter Mla MlaB component